MAHSFFRDSQFKSSVFLFNMTIFSITFSTCSKWDSSVAVTGFPDLSLSHKLASSTPFCLNCHSQCLTVLTSTHLSHTLPAIWWWMSMAGIFYSQKLNNSTLFELHVLIAYHFDWHWSRVMDSCGFKVTYGGGKIPHDCMEPVLSSFHYSNKKNMLEESKHFSPSSYVSIS